MPMELVPPVMPTVPIAATQQLTVSLVKLEISYNPTIPVLILVN